MPRNLLITFLLSFCVANGATKPDAIFVLIGDQHSAYARTAQFVGHVAQLRADNPGVPLAVLVNGDAFELGNVVSQRSGGAIDYAMYAALAHLAPTIVNLGNHEADLTDVASTVGKLREAGVTVIGNVTNRSTGELFAPASTLLTLGKVDTVIAGVTTNALSNYRAAIRPSLDLAVPAIWAQHHFPELLGAAPIKIVLSHAGLALDRDLFPFVPDGALLVGAHDHTRLINYFGRTVYVHSGSWNNFLSVARLWREPNGPRWEVQPVPIRVTDAADPALVAVVRECEAKFLQPEDRAPVGHLHTALSADQAPRFILHAVRIAAGVDAALIGATTFGDGLPAGNVSRYAFNGCVRFDGAIAIGEVDGATLTKILARANQDMDTPFAKRLGENLVADAIGTIDPAGHYRIAVSDWIAGSPQKFLGTGVIQFTPHPELRLKAIAAAALKP
jgi:5'-nucleotidase/UDP-sugar diphosphatase